MTFKAKLIRPRLALAISGWLCASTLSAGAISADNIAEALAQGETHLDFRLRFENVDQDDPANVNGDALTLKSRLNFKSEKYRGVTAFIEVDNVSSLDGEDHNNGINGKSGKAKIIDPEGTEINQAWLNYTWQETNIKYGRQRINLDNQRFVGGVGFRQNEQTYDGVSLTNKSLPETTLFYARVNNVNRIFGEDSIDGDHDSRTDLFNAKYRGFSIATISAYAYLIENKDLMRFSTDTYGIRLAGKTDIEDIEFGYTAELARQEDSNQNPKDYTANYLLLEGKVKLSPVTIALGYELLESDDGNAAFITPLATLHKFQGWSDQFLATPDQGIADAYLTVSGTIAGIKLLATYHDFASDKDNSFGHDDLGDEYGLLISKKMGRHGLSLKYASYQAGDLSFAKSDAEKLWLTATANF